MNLLNLIEDIQTADPEFKDRISPRRAAIKNITSFGTKVAAAALPFAFSTLFKKAYGQTATRSVTDVLNFALTAEIAELGLYNTGLGRAGLIPTQDRPAITLLRDVETKHVTFLKLQLGNNISSTNAALSFAANTPDFDYTANKFSTNAATAPFPNVFTNYDVFLAVLNAFEDTGVRAYKGQAPFLLGNATVLTAALNIHSVEARHAAFLRRLRAIRNTSLTIKPWITGDGATASGVASPTLAATAAASVYAGEAVTTQAGVNIAGFVSTSAAQEAFDEPLTTDQVLAILANFRR